MTNLEYILRSDLTNKHRNTLKFTIISSILSLSFIFIQFTFTSSVSLSTAALSMIWYAFYNSLYIYFSIRKIGLQQLAYIPIVGASILIYIFTLLRPAPTNLLGCFFLLILALFFMRYRFLYTSIALSIVFIIYYSYVVAPKINFEPSNILAFILWYTLIALYAFFIIRDQKKLLIKLFNLQTDTEKSHQLIKHIAHHDQMTQLPNRIALQNELERYLQTTDALTKCCTLFVLQIDNLKKSVHMFGKTFGDNLVLQLADRLQAQFGKQLLMARSGEDEFSFVLFHEEKNPVILDMAEQILQTCRTPIELIGLKHRITCSMGISVYPAHSTDLNEISHHAYIALESAKEKGGDCYIEFNNELKRILLNKQQIESRFINALENNEFHLYYQPKVSTRSQKIESYEALIRWIKPDGTFVMPDQFIAIAEESGHIIALGEWVLRKACQTAKKWSEITSDPFSIAVNISPVQLLQPQFDQFISSILLETNLQPNYLEIEVTETLLIESSSIIIPTLRNIRQMGIKVHLDDFGVGYSSLSYLKDLPIDVVKIDKSFIDDLQNHPKEKAIIRSIVDLATRINLKVVMEGVETEDEVEFLTSIHCDYLQGYYFSKPLPEEEIMQFLAASTPHLP